MAPCSIAVTLMLILESCVYYSCYYLQGGYTLVQRRWLCSAKLLRAIYRQEFGQIGLCFVPAQQWAVRHVKPTLNWVGQTLLIKDSETGLMSESLAWYIHDEQINRVELLLQS